MSQTNVTEKVTTKKERVENSVEIIDDEPKSPDTLRRQRVMEEAKLTIEGEKQKAIEIQQQRIMAMLDSGDSEKLGTDDSTLQEVSGVEADESQSMLEETENPDNKNTIVMSGDSLSQTLSQDKSVEVIPAEQSTQPVANEIFEEIQSELDSKTRSHEDAISEKNTLETMLAQEISHRKYIEMKLAQSKAELKANEDVVVNLQAALKNPAPPTNTEYSAEVQNKLKQLKKFMEDNRILTAKADSLKRENESLKKRFIDAKACAERERRNAQSFKHKVNTLTGDLNQLKGLTFCKVDSCPNEKSCGRSQARKEENKKDCVFWLKGYCRKEQRCKDKHSVEARTKLWDAEVAGGSGATIASSNNFCSGNANNNGKANNHGNTKHKNSKKQTHKQNNQGRAGQQQRVQNSPPPPPPAATTAPAALAPAVTASTPATAPLAPMAPLAPVPAPGPSYTPTSTSTTSSTQLQMTPLPPIGMLPSVQMPCVPMPGYNPMIGWGGINISQLTAMQAQSMTRMQRMEEVRVEINRVRELINTARSQLPGPGSEELQTLIQKESELTTQLNML